MESLLSERWWNHARWRLNGIVRIDFTLKNSIKNKKKIFKREENKEKRLLTSYSVPWKSRVRRGNLTPIAAPIRRNPHKKGAQKKITVFLADRFSFRFRRWSNNWREEKSPKNQRVFSALRAAASRWIFLDELARKFFRREILFNFPPRSLSPRVLWLAPKAIIFSLQHLRVLLSSRSDRHIPSFHNFTRIAFPTFRKIVKMFFFELI